MPICLPVNETLQQNVATLNISRVTGWGISKNGLTIDVLKEAVVPYVNNTNCQADFGLEIVSTQLCAGGCGRTSCKGYSGGPLAFPAVFNGDQKFVQFGIVSYGAQNCSDCRPGVYTNVFSYVPWIAYKIATK